MCSRAGKDKEVRAVVLKGEGKVRKGQLNRKLKNDLLGSVPKLNLSNLVLFLVP